VNTPSPRNVTLVTGELLGAGRAGGIGTAHSWLAIALARLGHRVEVLYYGLQAAALRKGNWMAFYERFGVVVRPVLPPDGSRKDWHWDRTTRIAERLVAAPPDVVIAQDLGAPAAASLRLRHLDLALRGTLFVVYCHGTSQWINECARRARVTDPAELASATILERSAVELADVLVSPSTSMLEWMAARGWALPAQRRVVPLLTRRAALGELASKPSSRRAGETIARLCFFGRLEERKGIGLLIAALERLDPSLLRGLELELLGAPTPTWPRKRVERALPRKARRALRSVSFASGLDQPAALLRLARPGTLVVMPALGDNSPNAIYECLELGVPFLASSAGGTSELVAPEDRERVLFEPTVDGLVEALERVLRAGTLPAPAAAPRAERSSLDLWLEAVAIRPRRPAAPEPKERIDVVVTSRGSGQRLARCLEALAHQEGVEATVVVALAGTRVPEPSELPAGVEVVRAARSTFEAARQAGLEAGAAPLVCFLDEEDVPDPDLLVTLARARASSGADVVTCGLRLREADRERVHLFLGEPGGLGVLENAYGTVALVRRTLLRDLSTAWPSEHDPDWVLLARLRLQGARIVSVPRPLVTTSRRPGTVDGAPGDALLVLEDAERALPDEADSAARLAAGLAAQAAQRASRVGQTGGGRPPRRRPLTTLALRAWRRP
jgi:glycosyltransferase involved in cell wall biosynthesis